MFPVPLESSSSVTDDPDREELLAVVAWSIVMLYLVAGATVSEESHTLHRKYIRHPKIKIPRNYLARGFSIKEKAEHR